MLKTIEIVISFENENKVLSFKPLHDYSIINFERLNEFLNIKLSREEKEKITDILQSVVNQIK